MGRLHINVLGAVRVQHGEAVLAFPTRKALALLVYLVVEGGQHSREKLAGLFWPDQDQPHARAMLRYTLAGMRQTLQDSADAPHILVEPGALGVDATSGIELDVDVLRTARRQTRTGTLGELRRGEALCRGRIPGGLFAP